MVATVKYLSRKNRIEAVRAGKALSWLMLEFVEMPTGLFTKTEAGQYEHDARLVTNTPPVDLLNYPLLLMLINERSGRSVVQMKYTNNHLYRMYYSQYI